MQARLRRLTRLTIALEASSKARKFKDNFVTLSDRLGELPALEELEGTLRSRCSTRMQHAMQIVAAYYSPMYWYCKCKRANACYSHEASAAGLLYQRFLCVLLRAAPLTTPAPHPALQCPSPTVSWPCRPGSPACASCAP